MLEEDKRTLALGLLVLFALWGIFYTMTSHSPADEATKPEGLVKEEITLLTTSSWGVSAIAFKEAPRRGVDRNTVTVSFINTLPKPPVNGRYIMMTVTGHANLDGVRQLRLGDAVSFTETHTRNKAYSPKMFQWVQGRCAIGKSSFTF